MGSIAAGKIRLSASTSLNASVFILGHSTAMAPTEQIEHPNKKRKLATPANDRKSAAMDLSKLKFDKKNEKQKRLPPSMIHVFSKFSNF